MLARRIYLSYGSGARVADFCSQIERSMDRRVPLLFIVASPLYLKVEI